jgi:hypothetical protein
MKTHVKILVSILMSFATTQAFADIQEFASIHLGADYKTGECELFITDTL